MWETWFRESGPQEVKSKLKSLQIGLNQENKNLHADIGDQFTDIIALSDRLESLRGLAEQQQSHLDKISNSSNYITGTSVETSSPNQTTLRQHTDAKLGAWLAFHADRSISRVKYAAAAQSIYLADALNIHSLHLDTQRRRLERKLEQWLKNGSLISQSTYTALLLYLQCNPLVLGQVFLERRIEHIKSLLKTPEGSSALFKLVDSTAFIFTQITNDLAQSRLTNRRLVEMPIFASSNGFNALIAPRMPGAFDIRCFPEQCYSTEKPENVVGVAEFIQSVSKDVREMSCILFNSLSSVEELTAVLSSVVQQSQDVLTTENGVVEILNAFEPAFNSRFLELIEGTADITDESKWGPLFSASKKEVAQLSRIARATKQSAPDFSKSLEKLESESQTKLTHNIKQCYERLRAKALSTNATSIENVSQQLVSLRKLDKSMENLDGTIDNIPDTIYTKFAELVKEHFDTKTANSKRVYFGNSHAAHAFEIQCLIDDYLQDFEWTPSSLDLVREIVLGDLPSVEEDALLLRPIVL